MSDWLLKFEHYLLNYKKVATNTFFSYKQDMLQFELFLNKQNVSYDSISIDQINQFIHFLFTKNLKVRSIARKITVLKLFFSYCFNQGSLDNNLGLSLVVPKIKKKLPLYISKEEVKKLFFFLEQGEKKSKRDFFILHLLYVLGIRVIELVSLRTSDIDLNRSIIFIKGAEREGRIVFLPDKSRELFLEYLEERSSFVSKAKNDCSVEWLFPVAYKKKIKPLPRQSLWIIIKKNCKKANIDSSISPRLLRNLYNVDYLEKESSLHSLQLSFGYKNILKNQLRKQTKIVSIRKMYDNKHPRS